MDMSVSVFAFAFLMGIKHSFEADHLATVATVVARTDSLQGALSQGVWWGIGHSLTLLTLSSIAFFTQSLVSEPVSNLMEIAVGAVLLLMGLELLWRRYGPARDSALAQHSKLESSAESHPARLSFSPRALTTGLIHGAAGSAAIILVTATSGSMLSMVGYVTLFSVGAMLGMATASLLICVPFLRRFADYPGFQSAFVWLVGGYSIAIGAALMLSRARALAGL